MLFDVTIQSWVGFREPSLIQDFERLQTFLSIRYAVYLCTEINRNIDRQFNSEQILIKDIHYPLQNDVLNFDKLGGIHILQYDKLKHDRDIAYETRVISDSENLYQYNFVIKSILQKANQCINNGYAVLDQNRDRSYKVVINRGISGKSNILKGLQSQVISKPEIYKTDDVISNNKIQVYSGNLEDCKRYMDYISSKPIRMLLYLGLISQNLNNKYNWRYVPTLQNLQRADIDDINNLFSQEELKIIDEYISDFIEHKTLQEKKLDKLKELYYHMAKVAITFKPCIAAVQQYLEREEIVNAVVMSKGLYSVIQQELSNKALLKGIRLSKELEIYESYDILQELLNTIQGKDVNSASIEYTIDLYAKLLNACKLINKL